MPKNDLLLRAARRERTERTPVWMMRQAGRFDPEYRAVRDRVNLPLEQMFRTPDLAAEISLLPKRLGVDAIIFYQDILTPLAPMGAEFVFRPGPVLSQPPRHSVGKSQQCGVPEHGVGGVVLEGVFVPHRFFLRAFMRGQNRRGIDAAGHTVHHVPPLSEASAQRLDGQ